MLERISSVRLQDEVRALASQPQALKASLREFGRHKTSEALFDYRGGMLSQVQAQGALSPESKNLLFDVFQSASDAEADREAKTELLARLAPEEQLGLIRAAEDSLDFRVAHGIANAMLERDSSPDDRELLHLVAARSAWLARAGEPLEDYNLHLEAASLSSNEEVAGQAKLWREATTYTDPR